MLTEAYSLYNPWWEKFRTTSFNLTKVIWRKEWCKACYIIPQKDIRL